MTTAQNAAGTAEPSGLLAGRRGSARAGRWLSAGLAVCTVGWGANQFAPMLLVYRPALGLSAAVVEATFGMYAIGLMPSLLIAGRVSDRIGRRPVVLFAVGLSMLAGIVLVLGANDVGLLFAGRLVMGVASGCAFSSGSAWIKELSTAPYEDAGAGAGARRASVAMTTGFGLGPLAAGVLGQWAPWPRTLPYVPQLILAVCAIAPLVRTPETVARGRAPVRRPRDAGTRTGAPGAAVRDGSLGGRRFLLVVLPLAPWVFGSAAIAMVFTPGLVLDRIPGIAVFFGALVATCTAMSGVLVQPLARRLDRPGRPHLLVTGMSLVTAGIVFEAGVAVTRQPALTLLAAVVLGCGYGVCLVFGLAEVQRMAGPDTLASMTAVFQAVTYVGFGAPYLLSVLETYASPDVLLLATAGLAAATLGFTGWQARR